MDDHASNEYLRSELTRLQDQEATLSHLLTLEKERRIRTEHLFEVEHLACFRLGHKLARHKTSLTDGRHVHHDRNCRSKVSYAKSVECPVKFKETHNSKASSLVAKDAIGAFSDFTKMSDTLLPISIEDDFAFSIFSQLTPDLQQVLGVSDTQEADDKEALFNATAAVLANNPDQLRKYASLSELRTVEGKSLLEMSCERGCEGCLRVLLEGGWRFSEVIANNQTLLHICAKYGHLNSVKVLMEFGADPNLRDNCDQTSLHLALRSGHGPTAQCLLQAGTSLTIVTKDGLSVLHAAVLGNLSHTLRLLITHLQASLEELQFKTLLNFPDTSGSTPLHIAVSRSHTECVGVLCACKEVGVASRDRWNRTPMNVAANEECRDLLRNRESRGIVVAVECKDHSSSSCGTISIGQLSVLPHHRLSDIEFLVADLLSQYSQSLQSLSQLTASEQADRVFTFDSGTTLSDRIQGECVLADTLKNVSARGKQYLQHCSKCVQSVCERVMPLGLAEDSVISYHVGSHQWSRGELDSGAGSRYILSMLTETQPAQIRISLKGYSDGCLDQLAFESMIPVAKLQNYIHLIKQNKALVIHGSQGSGKTHLARALAGYIKATKENTQVVYTALHPTFQRDDLFRLLHLNGLLSQQKGVSRQSYVVILDDLSSIQAPSVLAELLTSLEYRGAEMWVNEVYRRDGSLLYPCGHYYLTESAHFITTTSSETSPGSDWVDQFAHVSLDLAFSSGVLVRHLNARLVHATSELSPSPTLPLSRMVRWVVYIWVLYNNFVRRIGLLKLAVGVRHFIQCPMEFGKSESISSWLVSLWTHHLAPAIKSSLLTVPSESQNNTLQDYQLVSRCLSACVHVVFESCCPLSYEARENCMKQLNEVIESGETELKGGREETDAHKEKDAEVSAQSTASNPTSSSSPPHPAHKPPLPSQTGSMVSYEDMLRESPRNKPKNHNNEDNSTVSHDIVPEDNCESQPAAVTLRPKSRKSTLRKIRAKTISLFSKDSGSSTLPRLFRKEQRHTINPSATSDNLGSNQMNPAKEAKQLEDMFDLLTSANSKRFEDQRIPSPPPRAVSVCVDAELDKQRDLDSFLDLLSSVGTSRIDEQRSPPPSNVVSPKKSKKMKTVPRYILPTEPPLKEEYSEFPTKPLSPYRGSSPVPVYSSSTDIPHDVETRSSPCVTTQPVQRKCTNTSVSSYGSVFNDDLSSSCYTASVTDEVYTQNSPQSEPGFKRRYRANTYDACVISEPLRRRKPSFKMNHINAPSPANSTPLNIRSPISPLTVTMYSSPRESPSVHQTPLTSPQVTNPSNWHEEKLRIIKARSVANITEGDELGAINEFDLFRAASDGNLMQSSTKDDSAFNVSPTQKDTNAHNQENQSKKSSIGHQSNTDDSSTPSTPDKICSLKCNSSRTSGYVSNNYSNGPKSRRSSIGGIQNGVYHTSRRRYSVQYDRKITTHSPLSSLRRPSETSGMIGANLLYSASLGFDSLSSSRDRLSSLHTEVAENLTTEM